MVKAAITSRTKQVVKTPYSFTRFPNFLLEARAEISLSSLDMNILMVLLYHCRGKSKCWPAKKRIAEMVGASPRHVVNRLNILEGRGFLDRRVRTNSTTEYDLSKLFYMVITQDIPE